MAFLFLLTACLFVSLCRLCSLSSQSLGASYNIDLAGQLRTSLAAWSLPPASSSFLTALIASRTTPATGGCELVIIENKICTN